MLELSNLALAYTREHIYQKEVVIEIDSADKRGTFFG